jgi:hypothetical protein
MTINKEPFVMLLSEKEISELLIRKEQQFYQPAFPVYTCVLKIIFTSPGKLRVPEQTK